MNAHLDAMNRALRTFVQGLAVDTAAAVTLVLTAQLGDLHWTRAWWAALGVLLVKTAVSTAVAYASRRLKPPPAALAGPSSVSPKTI